jgi:hypothetical protein
MRLVFDGKISPFLLNGGSTRHRFVGQHQSIQTSARNRAEETDQLFAVTWGTSRRGVDHILRQS